MDDHISLQSLECHITLSLIFFPDLFYPLRDVWWWKEGFNFGAWRVCVYMQMHNNNEIKKESGFLIVNEKTKIKDFCEHFRVIGLFGLSQPYWHFPVILQDFMALRWCTIHTEPTFVYCVGRGWSFLTWLTKWHTQAVCLPLYDALPGIKGSTCAPMWDATYTLVFGSELFPQGELKKL